MFLPLENPLVCKSQSKNHRLFHFTSPPFARLFWLSSLFSLFHLILRFHLPYFPFSMTSTPVLFHTRDYRGATIEDLDIAPAISINPTTLLEVAIEISYENEFSYLPVIHEVNRKLLGILNVGSLRTNPSQLKKTTLSPIAKNYMLWFHHKARQTYERESQQRGNDTSQTALKATIKRPTAASGRKYDVLTPLTPLEDLALFFNRGIYFAIITNSEGTMVYGVATPEDLTKYENSRPRL